MSQKSQPKILDIKQLAKTRIFKIEQINLEFSNGQKRTFERLKAGEKQAVIVAAITESKKILLIKEYAVGTQQYEVGLPKGLVEKDESILDGANRELQEEAGYKAKNLTIIQPITLAPHYMSHATNLVIATGLSSNKLDGDEPEPLDVIECDINNIANIISKYKITEARTIASLYIVSDYINNNEIF